MLNVDALLAVMESVKENGIAELIITNDAVEIRTVLAAPVAQASPQVAMPVSAPAAPVEQAVVAEAPVAPKVDVAATPAVDLTNGVKVEAPIPGTIFVAPGKDMDGNPLPAVGDKVKKNQVVALLEAMKMFNEVFAPVSGTVVAINVTDETAVNPGDCILVIKEE